MLWQRNVVLLISFKLFFYIRVIQFFFFIYLSLSFFLFTYVLFFFFFFLYLFCYLFLTFLYICFGFSDVSRFFFLSLTYFISPVLYLNSSFFLLFLLFLLLLLLLLLLLRCIAYFPPKHYKLSLLIIIRSFFFPLSHFLTILRNHLFFFSLSLIFSIAKYFFPSVLHAIYLLLCYYSLSFFLFGRVCSVNFFFFFLTYVLLFSPPPPPPPLLLLLLLRHGSLLRFPPHGMAFSSNGATPTLLSIMWASFSP